MTNAQILVVEDEIIVARDIQNMLKGLGYAVPAVARSGVEAIQKIAEMQPDLVLMDIRLKGAIDGVKAAAQIRARFDIPVVYLTAYADEDTLQRAKITEPFGYILKPFKERELRTNVEMALYKHDVEKKLKESERWLATTLKSIGDAVIATDAKGYVMFMNPVAEALTGWRQEEALGKDLTEVFNIANEETQVAENPAAKVIREGTFAGLTNHTLIARDGTEMPIADSAAPIRDDKGSIIGAVLVFQDITERKRVEEEREKLILELQDALARIKTLRGLIPICASCKKIRDDQGYWNKLETYIQEHSEVEFSHGICPECAKKLYPDLFSDDEMV